MHIEINFIIIYFRYIVHKSLCIFIFIHDLFFIHYWKLRFIIIILFSNMYFINICICFYVFFLFNSNKAVYILMNKNRSIYLVKFPPETDDITTTITKVLIIYTVFLGYVQVSCFLSYSGIQNII